MDGAGGGDRRRWQAIGNVGVCDDLFVSVVTIGEIERGIERQRQTDLEFSQPLASWLEAVLRTYEDRILVVDVAIARQWGRLSK